VLKNRIKQLREKIVSKRFADNTSVTSTTTSLQRDEWLEAFAVGYRDNALVLDAFMPEKRVKKDSAKYRVYASRGRFKAAPKRGETALPEQDALEYSEDTYTTEEYALEGWVSDDAVRNAASDIAPFRDETEYLSQKVLLTQEILIANEIFAAVKAGGDTYYTTLTSSTKWEGGDSADILGDISTAIKAIALSTGRRPNLMSMNTDTYEVVIHDSTVQDILKRASTGPLTDAMPLAQLRGMRILMADAIVNTGTYDSPTYKNILYDVDTTTALNQTVVIGYVRPGDKLNLGVNFVSKPFRVYRGRGLEGDRRQADLVAVWKKLAPKVTNVGACHVIGKVLG